MELVSALAEMLVPISRALLSRDSGFGVLVLAAKLSYLRAALQSTSPKGARINISRLSVATGMTRKEVAALLRATRVPDSAPHPRPTSEQRALRVIRGWRSDPLFMTTDGRPAPLELRGGGHTFTALVRAYAGDVTPASVLKELERIRAVTRRRDGKLKLKSTSVPATKSHTHVNELARRIRDFAEAAGGALEAGNPPVYFGFRSAHVDAPVQVALFKRTFARRAALLLAGFDDWSARQAASSRGRRNRKSERSKEVGVGIYVIQRDIGGSD